MTLQIWGTFLENISPNEYVHFDLTLNREVSIHYSFSLCNMYHLDTWQWFRNELPGRSYPPREGWAEIMYTVLVPDGSPGDGGNRDGNWTARAAFVTSDERNIFCLEGW
jgi:hypothetical protein